MINFKKASGKQIREPPAAFQRLSVKFATSDKRFRNKYFRLVAFFQANSAGQTWAHLLDRMTLKWFSTLDGKEVSNSTDQYTQALIYEKGGYKDPIDECEALKGYLAYDIVECESKLTREFLGPDLSEYTEDLQQFYKSVHRHYVIQADCKDARGAPRFGGPLQVIAGMFNQLEAASQQNELIHLVTCAYTSSCPIMKLVNHDGNCFLNAPTQVLLVMLARLGATERREMIDSIEDNELGFKDAWVDLMNRKDLAKPFSFLVDLRASFDEYKYSYGGAVCIPLVQLVKRIPWLDERAYVMSWRKFQEGIDEPRRYLYLRYKEERAKEDNSAPPEMDVKIGGHKYRYKMVATLQETKDHTFAIIFDGNRLWNFLLEVQPFEMAYRNPVNNATVNVIYTLERQL